MTRSKQFFAVLALAAAAVIGMSAPAVAAGGSDVTSQDHYAS